jgi:hypothetical protein
MSKQRRARIRLVGAERAELERRVAARTSSQQDVYRAQIILRMADGQTNASIKDRPKCPPPRQYHADIQARLLVLACQKPAEVDATRAGQIHWSINDLAQYLPLKPWRSGRAVLQAPEGQNRRPVGLSVGRMTEKYRQL